jgi:hypothetical protein
MKRTYLLFVNPMQLLKPDLILTYYVSLLN